MIVSIDPNSLEPIYLQLYSSVVSAIAMGEIVSGDVLPSSRKLAGDLGINYHTVNKAYNLLEMEGFVLTEKKRVVVASSNNEDRDLFAKKWRTIIMELLFEAKAKGFDPEEINRLFNGILKEVMGGRA